MANIVPNSFKSGLLKGTFNFDTSGNGGNTFKCALYTAITGYNTSSTVYLAGTGNNEDLQKAGCSMVSSEINDLLEFAGLPVSG